MTESDLIMALTDHPKLLQRPVVESTTQALIARDSAKLEEWLNSLKKQ